MEMITIVGQIIGLFAMAFNILSYQQKSQAAWFAAWLV